MHTDECTGVWERWLPAISTIKICFRKVNTDFGYIHRRKESKSDQRAGCQPARSTPWQLRDWSNICQNREKEDGNIGVKLGLCLNDVAKLAGNKRREHCRPCFQFRKTSNRSFFQETKLVDGARRKMNCTVGLRRSVSLISCKNESKGRL
jgi:hypothetical protein